MPALPTRELRFAYLWLCRGGDQAWQNVLHKPPLRDVILRPEGPKETISLSCAADAVRWNLRHAGGTTIL